MEDFPALLLPLTCDGTTGPPPTGDSQVSVGNPVPDTGVFGKVTGSFPDGTFEPKIVDAGRIRV